MKIRILVVAVLMTATAAGAALAAGGFGPWSAAVNLEQVPGTDPSVNTTSNDGCPISSPDGRELYVATNRPGGLGGIDIWVSTRDHAGAPWGPMINLGEPVNSSADDFCPSPTRLGDLFLFVSTRAGGCGGSDIYWTRLRESWPGEAVNAGCRLNSAADEASPSLLLGHGLPVLYFSSTRPGGFAADPPGATVGDSDLYQSRWLLRFGEPELVPGVNTEFVDARPNVRNDGLEVVFDSNRPGTLGSQDVYASTREQPWQTWTTPANLGPNVNSAAAETRASLSGDGTTLLFGSTRPGGEGGSDVYMSTRSAT